MVSGALLYFCANLFRAAIPGAVFDELQYHWSLSAGEVASLGTAFMYVYAVAQLIVGVLIDRYGGVRVMAVGGMFFVAGSVLFALAPGYGMLLAARLLCGLGASGLYLGVITEILRYFKKNYTIIISIIVMTGYVGAIVANAPFASGVSSFGLLPMLWVLAGMVTIFYLCFIGNSMQMNMPMVKHKEFSLSQFAELFKNRQNIYVFGFLPVNWGLFYSLQTVVGKKFLEDYCGMSSGNAALIFSLTGAVSAAGGFVYAWCSLRMNNRKCPFFRLTSVVSLLVFIMLPLLIYFDVRSPLFVVLFIMLAGVSSLSSLIIPLLKEINSKENTGSVIAFQNFLSYALVGVSGNIIGWVMDRFEPVQCGSRLIYSPNAYMTVFGVMSIGALIVFYCGMNLRESYELPQKKG